MRTAYSTRQRVAIENTEPAVTVQYFKEECDIHNILAKYSDQGVLFQHRGTPQYGDFTDIQTYQDALNAVLEANEGFLELPSDIRKYFNNDPKEFVEFCSNEKNLDEMRRLGLAPEAREIQPDLVKNEGTKPPETTE